jgi:hypothetical protein
MKPLSFMSCFFIVTLVLGCREHQRNQPGNKFFEYDEIEYYFDNYDEAKIDELYDNQSRSAFDSIKMGVILGDIPRTINDLTFISKLKKIGYSYSKVDTAKFQEIDQIFQEKETKENVAASCIYIYRDILVFKKKHSVVGVAKICFGCLAHHIVGTNASTENFGQDGDYYKLEKILNRKPRIKNGHSTTSQ